jgi:hypothetical protein
MLECSSRITYHVKPQPLILPRKHTSRNFIHNNSELHQRNF